jgi:hypothetical protein
MDPQKIYFPEVKSPSLLFKKSTPLVYNKYFPYHTEG